MVKMVQEYPKRHLSARTRGGRLLRMRCLFFRHPSSRGGGLVMNSSILNYAM